MQSLASHLLPSPSSFFGHASNVGFSAMIGAGYGFIARRISPQSGISPINYAIWFATAHKIQDVALRLLDNVHWMEYPIVPQICHVACVIDDKGSSLLGIRPSYQITAQNVQQATFIEMCRYRIGKVVKLTIIGQMSFALTHGLCTTIGIRLPKHTIVPIFFLALTIIKGVVGIPILHNAFIWGSDKVKSWKLGSMRVGETMVKIASFFHSRILLSL